MWRYVCTFSRLIGVIGLFESVIKKKTEGDFLWETPSFIISVSLSGLILYCSIIVLVNNTKTFTK